MMVERLVANIYGLLAIYLPMLKNIVFKPVFSKQNIKFYSI